MIRNCIKIRFRTAALLLGGTLLIPGFTAHAETAQTPYTAKPGDTFWQLSKKFGVPLQSLLQANPDVDPLNIQIGMKLNIPPRKSAGRQLPSGSSEKPVGAVTTATGESLAYTKVLDVKATAYSDSLEENAWGPVDSFGNPLKLGTIAVDPKVIPFGTKVYITGYNFDGLPEGGLIASATDSGSAIKGNRIDIFVPGKRSYVATFGVQDVKVYILK